MIIVVFHFVIHLFAAFLAHVFDDVAFFTAKAVGNGDHWALAEAFSVSGYVFVDMQ